MIFRALNLDAIDTPLGTIADTLESLAQRQPKAPAIHVPGRETLTYGHLGAQIRYVRERLGNWGIQPGDIVCAAIASRAEMAVAIATLPSSCTIAPLDPSLPSETYVALLTRMKAKAILVTSGDEHAIRAAARRLGIAEIDVMPERDAAAGLFTLTLGRGGSTLAAGNTGDPRIAYILTSSGTTGRRKLVPAEHRAMLVYAPAIRDWLDFTPADVGVHITPMYFGQGLQASLIIALLAGRSVVCLPVADIEALFASIEEYRPTFLTAGFSLFQGILRRAPEFRAAIAQNRFRFMRSGSGHLDLEAADRLEQLFGAPMLTGLSSTETSRISHDPLPPRRRKRGALGLPLVNEVALLDSAGNIHPNGGPGEIVVRGPMVFRGYLDDPELNAASFVGAWFRTGDLGRIDEDGYVYFVGRIKEIINRGGEKISPVEIDLAIESLPGVKEAAAFAIPHPSLGEEMVAAVVREENAAIDEAQVVEHVRARAGVRKVPRRVYFVESLPRTDNGKLRRNALPELFSLDAAPDTVSATDETGTLSPLESELAGVWSSLLQVPKVGRDDDFFLLGGDSLRGTQLITRIKTSFGVDLCIQSLFGEAATVAGMARAIEDIRAGEHPVDPRADIGTKATADIAIRPRRDRGPAPLSHAQLRMWFLARLDPDSRAYNLTTAYRLAGSIDVMALRESLLAIVQRHEILRTTYALVDDEPRQIVHATAKLDFQCLELAATPLDTQQGALMKLIEDEERRAFDFEAGPLARFRLIRLADGDHVLLRVCHHIISDPWTTRIFEREFSIAYSARVSGESVVLPELELQYADYALWQRAWLKGVEGERQLGYWREQLKGLGTLELPTDRPRPAVQSYRGARVDVILPGELVGRMSALGRAEGATLFMAWLAAFLVLLYRHSGAEDIAVGTQTAGRQRAESEGLMGVFLNTLVLRGNLTGEPSFRQFLARVRARALAAYANQDLPFEKLVEELAPSRALSRNPLFQVSFMWQYPETTLQLKGLRVNRLEPPRRSARFDLMLLLRETEQGLQASWEYNTDLYDAQTIERMAGHFERLIEGIVADPEQRIGELPLLGEAERHQLLVQWNDTAVDYPKDRCIHELFEAQAARRPEALAVIFEDQQLTYAELNARANQLAHHLIGLGVGPEVLVGVCLERSLELIVALLGILKAGGAYVPLDPGYPAKRLEFMLHDTQAPVLLTQQGLLEQLPPYEGRIVRLDSDWEMISALPHTAAPCQATAESLAYVIYTSGSTGTPKGVAVPHRGVLRLLLGIDYVQLDERQTFLLLSPISFDASTFELWGALLHGARCAIFGERVPTIETLGEVLQRYQVSTLWLTASLFNVILDEAPQILSGVRQLLTGGEALSPTHVRAALKQLPEVQLINGYGPTESTTFTCCYRIPNPLDDTRGSIPIGRPIRNTRVYVLDRYLSPAPLGVAGQLYIGGDGLARGYLNRPELSAEKFLPDPFSSVPGARMYGTGDRVRYLPEGNIEFLGRLDDQVKLRGFRIELGEIETVLCEHPGVRQAVVIAREDTPGDKRLVAYVVRADDASLADFEPLRALLRERLPDYMRPATYVTMQRLPLTPNGKVDRHALPAPEYRREQFGNSFVAPRSALEEMIAEVWREVLKVERVGVHDNFFELGGHSLLAAQVVARLTKLLKVDLPLRRMFEASTIAELAGEVAGVSPGADEGALERILSEVEALTDEETAQELVGNGAGIQQYDRSIL